MGDSNERPSVLLVDDEPAVLRGLRLHLQKQFDVDIATSGQEGLERMRAHEYHVVVSDMRMPGMNGAEFLKRARDLAPETTRFLLTGYADADAAIRAVNDGQIFRFMTKPIHPPDFVAAIAEGVLERKRRRQDRTFIETESQRVSRKMLRAQQLANLGELAVESGIELANLAAIHRSMLDAVLAQREGGEVTAADLEDLRWIEDSLRRHAEGLLSLAGGETNREPREFDLRDVVTRTLESLQVMGRLKHVDITMDFDDVPNTLGHPERVQQALLNLVINALEALESKDPYERRIRLSVLREKNRVVCCVADNGPGIHSEVRPFIFKRYFSTKPEAPGLGLTAALQLAEGQGGSVTLDESYQEGARFRLELPAER